MQFEPMRSGETIRNDATGETLTMLESEEENGGVRDAARSVGSEPDEDQGKADSKGCGVALRGARIL
jgi:hypothetical protein